MLLLSKSANLFDFVKRKGDRSCEIKKKRIKKRHRQFAVLFLYEQQGFSEKLLDSVWVSKDFAQRLDQLQIAKSDDLDKNLTRGFERGRTCFCGEEIAPYIWFRTSCRRSDYLCPW